MADVASRTCALAGDFEGDGGFLCWKWKPGGVICSFSRWSPSLLAVVGLVARGSAEPVWFSGGQKRLPLLLTFLFAFPLAFPLDAVHGHSLHVDLIVCQVCDDSCECSRVARRSI